MNRDYQLVKSEMHSDFVYLHSVSNGFIATTSICGRTFSNKLHDLHIPSSPGTVLYLSVFFNIIFRYEVASSRKRCFVGNKF